MYKNYTAIYIKITSPFIKKMQFKAFNFMINLLGKIILIGFFICD